MSSEESSSIFWPWGRRSALAASAALLIVLVGGVVALRLAFGWPEAQWEGPILLAAALLSLVPIGLLVLATVAESSGSVSFRGLSIAFGATAQAVATTVTGSTIPIPRNVTQEGADVGDSGSNEVVRVLENASRAEVVVVDLEDGHAWWDSRLLLLCAGATLQNRPRAVVFVATIDTMSRSFVGWSHPADVVTQIRNDSAELSYAYASAQASLRRAELTFPGRAEPGGWPAVIPALPSGVQAGPMQTPVVNDQELFAHDGLFLLPQSPAVAFTKALGRAVHPLEKNGGVSHLSVVRLRQLLLPVLHTRSTEDDASDADWVKAVVDNDNEYIVVTHRGVYRGLAPRERMMAALLRALALSALDLGQPSQEASQ